MIPALATVLVNALWQPAAVFAIAWLALRLSRCTNATTRHTVWTIALVASIVVPFVSAASLVQPHAQPAVSTHVVSKPQALKRTSTARPQTQIPSLFERPRVSVQPTIAEGLVVLWALVALVLFVRLAASFLYLERLKRDALPLSVEKRGDLRRWDGADKRGRQVRICVTEHTTVPVAVGLFDAMILLPQDLLGELDACDLDRVLLHELAHVCRGDDWVNLIERIALALFFFSPGMYWIARQMDLEREVACDDWVLAPEGENVPYARCLTRIAEMTEWPHRPIAAPGVFITRKSMSIRIERLLAHGRDIRVRLALAPTMLSFVAIAVVVIAGGFTSPTIAYTIKAPAPHVPLKRVIAAKPKPQVKPAVPVHRIVAASEPQAKPVERTATPLAHISIPKVRVVAVSSMAPPSESSGGYLDDLAAAGLQNLTPDDVIALKSVGVTGDYIRAMRATGFPNLTPHALIELKSLDITPGYVTGLRSAGLTNLTADAISGMKSMGITGEYITDLANAGYPHLHPEDYEAFKSLGITGDYIRGLSKHFDKLTIERIEEFKAMGIEPK